MILSLIMLTLNNKDLVNDYPVSAVLWTLCRENLLEWSKIVDLLQQLLIIAMHRRLFFWWHAELRAVFPQSLQSLPKAPEVKLVSLHPKMTRGHDRILYTRSCIGNVYLVSHKLFHLLLLIWIRWQNFSCKVQLNFYVFKLPWYHVTTV